MTNPVQGFSDFILWERETNDTIDFKTIYVDMVGGDIPTGLMLSQLVYWRLPSRNRDASHTKLTITREDRKWLAKSDGDWYAETRLSVKQARRCRGILESLGLVDVRFWKFGDAPMTHISINEEAFMARFREVLSIPLEVRDAGPLGSKPRALAPKNPGSKPTSGNRRKAEDDQDTGGINEQPQQQASARHYPNGNVDITQTVKSTLPEGQSPHYPNGKVDLPSGASRTLYTESTSEISSEIPAKNVVVDEENHLPSEAPLGDFPAPDENQAGHNNNIQAEPETAHPPVGGSADADITDEDLEAMFGMDRQQAHQTDDTETEHVPPAAPPAPAAFVPSPESMLEVGQLLAPKLGGKSKLQALLAEPGRDNVREKASWLDLDPRQVEGILADAKTKCKDEGVTFMTAITRRLDAALGARDVTKLPERPEGASATPGTLGAAYEVKPSVVAAELRGEAPTSPPDALSAKFEVGEQWLDKSGQAVTITGKEGVFYTLSSGARIQNYILLRDYTYAGAHA